MIVRMEHHRSYAVIQNATLRDKRLSFKARGLLAYLLSLPDNATIDRDQLAKVGPDGIRAVRSAMAELAAAGYLERREYRTKKGRFGVETILREDPTLVVPAGLDPTLRDDLDDPPRPPKPRGAKRSAGGHKGKGTPTAGRSASAVRTVGTDQPRQGKTAGQTAGSERAIKREVPIEVPLVVPALSRVVGTLTSVLDPATTTKRDGYAKRPKLKPKAKPAPHRDRLALRLWERFPDLDYDGALALVEELRAMDIADTVIDEGIGYTLQREDIASPRFLVSVVTDWFNQRTG